jgi:hypothetical protein
MPATNAMIAGHWKSLIRPFRGGSNSASTSMRSRATNQ